MQFVYVAVHIYPLLSSCWPTLLPLLLPSPVFAKSEFGPLVKYDGFDDFR